MWFVSFSYIFGLKKCTQIRWSFHEAISHPYTLSRIPMCPTCSQLQMLRWGSLSNLVMLLPHGLEGQARDSRIVGLGVGREVSCHDIWFIWKDSLEIFGKSSPSGQKRWCFMSFLGPVIGCAWNVIGAKLRFTWMIRASELTNFAAAKLVSSNKSPPSFPNITDQDGKT